MLVVRHAELALIVYVVYACCYGQEPFIRHDASPEERGEIILATNVQCYTALKASTPKKSAAIAGAIDCRCQNAQSSGGARLHLAWFGPGVSRPRCYVLGTQDVAAKRFASRLNRGFNLQ